MFKQTTHVNTNDINCNAYDTTGIVVQTVNTYRASNRRAVLLCKQYDGYRSRRQVENADHGRLREPDQW